MLWLSVSEARASTQTILIMGDSLSAAYNIATAKSWPVLMQGQFDEADEAVQIVNASISGETTQGGKARLSGMLSKHKPDILVIELGGNDGLRGFPFSLSRRNLSGMIEMALDQDILVLMIGVRLPPNLGPIYNLKFQQMYQSVADEYAIQYLPRFLEGVAADKAEYMQTDGIHPTALAQLILADKVFQVLQAMINP